MDLEFRAANSCQADVLNPDKSVSMADRKVSVLTCRIGRLSGRLTAASRKKSSIGELAHDLFYRVSCHQ
jgi:hypothetical protein